MVDASYYCLFAACGSCPADAGELTGMCYEKVVDGDCKTYTDAQSTCESTLTGSPADCETTSGKFEARLHKTVSLLCGIPGDGRLSNEAGAGDAGEGGPGPGDASASDAGPADTSSGDTGAADVAQE
jgi:hypothetical protein